MHVLRTEVYVSVQAYIPSVILMMHQYASVPNKSIYATVRVSLVQYTGVPCCPLPHPNRLQTKPNVFAIFLHTNTELGNADAGNAGVEHQWYHRLRFR